MYDLSVDPEESAPLLPKINVTLPLLWPNSLHGALRHGTEAMKLKPDSRSSGSNSTNSISRSSSSHLKEEMVLYERLNLTRFGLAMSDALVASIKRWEVSRSSCTSLCTLTPVAFSIGYRLKLIRRNSMQFCLCYCQGSAWCIRCQGYASKITDK